MLLAVGHEPMFLRARPDRCLASHSVGDTAASAAAAVRAGVGHVVRGAGSVVRGIASSFFGGDDLDADSEGS